MRNVYYEEDDILFIEISKDTILGGNYSGPLVKQPDEGVTLGHA